MRLAREFVIAGLLATPSLHAATGESWTLTVVAAVEQKGDHPLPELFVDTGSAKWNPDDRTVTLSGRFNAKNVSLIDGRKPIKVEDDGTFSHAIPLDAEPVSDKPINLTIYGVAVNGTLSKHRFVGRWYVPPPVAWTPRWTLSPSLGFSSIAYRDTRTTDFDESALTLKAAASRVIVPRQWDAGMNVFVTVAQLGTSQPDTTAQYLGINARVGRVLPLLPSPWVLMLHGGLYFTTSYVTAPVNGKIRQLGFRNMVGPQLFPTVGRALGKRSELRGYFKFSPVSSGFNLLDFGNREIAYGGAYVYALGAMPARTKIAFTLDVSTMSLQLQDVAIRSSSVSLGVGMNWAI